MSRRLRYHRPDPEDEEEFETPALREAVQEPSRLDRQQISDESDEDLQSESGLGESPEEDMIGQASDGEDGGGSDSDEPEDVSFSASRQSEQKRLQCILDDIRKGREEKKDQRRKRDKLFKLQKEDKMAELNKRKLPQDLLDGLADSGKRQKTTAGKKNTEEQRLAAGTAEEDVEGEDADDGPGLTWSDEDDQQDSADFILLGAEDSKGAQQLQVVSLQAEKRRGQISVSQNVASFKRDMLYGGRHRRVTNQQANMATAKRKARH